MKILFLLGRARAVLHTVAILASAGASALAAVTMGGDPLMGAVLGASANTAVAVLT